MRYTKVLLLFLLVLSACAPRSFLPMKESLKDEPAWRMIIAGKGEAYVYKENAWQRTERFDYEFIVAERDIEGGWEAVKEIHRRHPDFPRWAGKRDMALYFKVAKKSDTEFEVQCPFGNGTGRSDAGGNNVVMEIAAKASAPFNAIRITQRFDREGGTLSETVELFKKKKDGTEEPFIKIEEAGVIYLPK